MSDPADPPCANPAAIRVFHFCPWADRLETVESFLHRLPERDIGAKLSDSADPSLRVMARLDCDWHGENARAFAAMRHPALSFRPASVLGVEHIMELLQLGRQRPPHEKWWLVFMGQHPQALAGTWGKLGPLLRKLGIHVLYYAFDEASRTMDCFLELAPHLDVLIHDEAPLTPEAHARLRRECREIHRSWVANIVPFSVPFVEEPERAIVFLGSKLGLTPHRQRQIAFLQAKFKNCFYAFHDHSVAVADRGRLNRYKVSLCPEGRKFATRAMSETHTDRPFWSGCLGMSPVSEDSAAGGRLEELHREGLILRYPHGDLSVLAERCEQALELGIAERRRIYSHFNREETVGTVVANLIAESLRTP